MKSILLIAAYLFSFASFALDKEKKMTIAVVGELKLKQEDYKDFKIGQFKDLDQALATRPSLLVVNDLKLKSLKILEDIPLPTFISKEHPQGPWTNPNVIAVASPFEEKLESILKLCPLPLFKSAFHIRTCLKPYIEKGAELL